jgi:hypothetical protein
MFLIQLVITNLYKGPGKFRAFRIVVGVLLYPVLRILRMLVWGTFFKNVVLEYRLVKKIIYVALPLFIILTSLSFIQQNITLPFGLLIENSSQVRPSPISIYDILSAIWIGLFFTVSGGLLRMLFWLGRKEFRYNFAVGCAEMSQDKEEGQDKEEEQQLEYLLLSLESYNKYLRGLLKLRVNDLIFSNIALIYFDHKDEIKGIAASFKPDADAGVLAPMKYLSEQIAAKN